MNRISYSQLSMFSDCPFKWKLNYVDKLSISDSNIFLIFGTAMHEVIQNYLNVMYEFTTKRADQLNLEQILQIHLRILMDPIGLILCGILDIMVILIINAYFYTIDTLETIN